MSPREEIWGGAYFLLLGFFDLFIFILIVYHMIMGRQETIA
jgi:hypothetical protein